MFPRTWVADDSMLGAKGEHVVGFAQIFVGLALHLCLEFGAQLFEELLSEQVGVAHYERVVVRLQLALEQLGQLVLIVLAQDGWQNLLLINEYIFLL